MNYVRKQRKTFRTFAAFVAAMVMLVLAGAARPAQAQTYTVITVIESGDFNNPSAQEIVQGRNGDLYTTDCCAGPVYGVFFSATTGGTLTDVYNVDYVPYGGASLGTDGNFYGTNYDGGDLNTVGACPASACGQVFKVTPGGVVTFLHDFSGDLDGGAPESSPVEAPNGIFYGTTTSLPEPSPSDLGVIYSVTSTGTFTVLHTFAGPDGSNPSAQLAVGSDGNLYGGTQSGGTNNDGVLFRITPEGTYTVLHNLAGTDGNGILSGLTLASDGNLYGVTYDGGTDNQGVIFKLTNSGVYTVIYNILNPYTGGITKLAQATDGKLYGLLGEGNGWIYSVTTSGTFTILHEFCQQTNCTDGANPGTPLVQSTDGKFYSVTSHGGDTSQCQLGCGVFYSLDMGLAPFASLVSTSGEEGAKIGILGQGFSSSSVVKFGGTEATTVTRSATTFLTATVPAAALTGAVTVTTGSTTLTSSQTFKVTPTMASFSPPSGPVGQLVTINGTGLTQATKVTFNKTSASFTVVSDIEITATVPAGATTGKIVVTTKGGGATSATSFTVD
jgi:uncharacterized repeat protein (TIGR03803 family)